MFLLDFSASQSSKIDSEQICLDQQGIAAAISTDITSLACSSD